MNMQTFPPKTTNHSAPEALLSGIAQLLSMQGIKASDQEAMAAAKTLVRLRPPHRCPTDVHTS
jgi:hypothetical protein